MGDHGVAEEFERADRVPIGAAARIELGPDLAERIAVGEELAPGEVGGGSPLVRLRRGMRACVPPCEPELAVEGREAVGQVVYEVAGCAHAHVLPRTATVITVSSAQWIGSGMAAALIASSTAAEKALMPSLPSSARTY